MCLKPPATDRRYVLIETFGGIATMLYIWTAGTVCTGVGPLSVLEYVGRVRRRNLFIVLHYDSKGIWYVLYLKFLTPLWVSRTTCSTFVTCSWTKSLHDQQYSRTTTHMRISDTSTHMCMHATGREEPDSRSSCIERPLPWNTDVAREVLKVLNG